MEESWRLNRENVRQLNLTLGIIEFNAVGYQQTKERICSERV